MKNKIKKITIDDIQDAIFIAFLFLYLAFIASQLVITSIHIREEKNNDSVSIEYVSPSKYGSYIVFSDHTGYYLEGKYNVTENDLYLLTGTIISVVYDVENDCDIVTMESNNGNIYTFFTDVGDYKTADHATCIIEKNATGNNDNVIGTL